MPWELNGQTEAVEQALSGGKPQRLGWFRFYFEDQRWEWSDQMHRMHGYQPGTVTPTTDLVLSHKHPEDRAHVAATIDDMMRTRAAFSTRHRIVDTAGVVHHVVVVGDQFCDDRGEVVGTHGFYVEIAAEADAQDTITAEVAAIAERRSAIDLAKGMLMAVYGVDEDVAFNVLRSLSQVHNVKLGALARRIVKDFSELGGTDIASRTRFDRLLLTVHERVSDRDGAEPAAGDG